MIEFFKSWMEWSNTIRWDFTMWWINFIVDSPMGGAIIATEVVTVAFILLFVFLPEPETKLMGEIRKKPISSVFIILGIMVFPQIALVFLLGYLILLGWFEWRTHD